MLQSSYHGVHQVSGVRALSPAHQCGKLQEGDELVQVSYQTVVSDDHGDAFENLGDSWDRKHRIIIYISRLTVFISCYSVEFISSLLVIQYY